LSLTWRSRRRRSASRSRDMPKRQAFVAVRGRTHPS
jgi:hypothetical protein